MSYASPMHTKHALCLALSGLLAGCGDDFSSVTQSDTDTEGMDDVPSPTGVSAGWDDETSAGDAGGSGGECGNGPACAGETPFCVDGDCVGCSDLDDPNAACESLDPEAPVCTDAGCTECGPLDDSACVEGTPVCGDDGSCRACVAHDECDTACDLETGWCFEEAVVLGEDGLGVSSGELSALIETVEPGGRLAVRIVPGDACLLDTLVVDDERRIALLGETGQRPCITSWDERAAITVAADSALVLVDVRIEESYGVAVDARGASVSIERSELVNNQGGAIAISQDGFLSVRNSMVGGDRNNVSVLSTHSSTLDISYTTMVAGFGDARALVCDGDNEVTVRNSIIVSEASLGELDCSAAEVTYSAMEAVFGEGNVAVGAVDTGLWFADYGRGDLHLQREAIGMPFEGVARWTDLDPRIDIDGDPRPAVEGAEDWAGADIP